jgi:hypothetical protein
MIEILRNKTMQLPLLCHHWITMLFLVWGLAAVSDLEGSPLCTRLVFLMTLYVSAEQCVFFSMLLYRFRSHGFPRTLFCSAIFYVVTRVAISVGILIAWWDVRSIIWDTENLQLSAISMWIFCPVGNLILNWTQTMSAISQFGIAANVLKKQLAWQENTTRGRILMEVFDEIDGGSGRLTLQELCQFFEGFSFDIVLPAAAIDAVVESFAHNGDGQVEWQVRETLCYNLIYFILDL